MSHTPRSVPPLFQECPKLFQGLPILVWKCGHNLSGKRQHVVRDAIKDLEWNETLFFFAGNSFIMWSFSHLDFVKELMRFGCKISANSG